MAPAAQSPTHGYRFRRQYGVGSYVLDFYCPDLKGQPFRAREYDQERQRYIESLGIRVLRFTNREVFERLDDLARGIAAFAGGRRGGTP
jgi:very-short-patch-repair endonuclease